ncbi:MAG: inner membrane protein YjeH [Osedax symbiont Rs1]|nr:MAG: inner membrane protein YjeH [Osedax symbiont Rs1]
MQHTQGTIGRWQGAGLMATTLLGTGVFILPQITVELAETGALWAWLLLTLAIIPVTLVFGRLSSLYPHAGGPAHFIEKAFGSLAGRCIGLSFLLLIPIGSAAAILISYTFLSVMVDIPTSLELPIQLAMTLLILLLNLKGINVSAKLQFSLTLIIVAIVALMLVFSGTEIQQYTLASNLAAVKLDPVLAAVGIAFWSFLGVEAMSHLANDFKDPKKDMLAAMMLGTVLVGVIYIACTYLLLALPNHSTLGFVDIFDQLFGGYGAQVIGGLGIASGLATVNVYIAGASRLLHSFSLDRVLPAYFTRLNSHHVPVRALVAIIITMMIAISCTFIYSLDLEQLIIWTNGVFVIIYSATMLAALQLLKRKYIPLVLIGCLFFIAIAYSIGSGMLYAVVMQLFLLPILLWQQKRADRLLESGARPEGGAF